MAGVPNFIVTFDDWEIEDAHRRYRTTRRIAIAYEVIAAGYAVAGVVFRDAAWFWYSGFFVAFGLFWLIFGRRALKKTYWELGRPFERKKGKGNGRYRGTAEARGDRAGGGTRAGAGAGGGASVTTPQEFGGIGLTIEPVQGVRAFAVDQLGRLTGVMYPQVWRPGENQAECRAKQSEAAAQTFSAGGGIAVSMSAAGMVSIAPAVGPMAPVPFDPSEPHGMEKCFHGFYAYYDGSNDYHRDNYINGVIKGSGEAIIGSRGFRCMKAQIVALHIPEKVILKDETLVRRNYKDIPFFDTFEDMVRAFPPDGGSKALAPDTNPDFWDWKL